MRINLPRREENSWSASQLVRTTGAMTPPSLRANRTGLGGRLMVKPRRYVTREISYAQGVSEVHAVSSGQECRDSRAATKSGPRVYHRSLRSENECNDMRRNRTRSPCRSRLESSRSRFCASLPTPSESVTAHSCINWFYKYATVTSQTDLWYSPHSLHLS